MRIAVALVVPALVIGLASSAWADKDKDRDRGHGNKHRGQTVVVQPVRLIVPDRDRVTVYTYYRSEFVNGRCPPGLARKGIGCLPPGQARNGWSVGRPLPPTIVYEPVPAIVVQQLEPVPPGYGYVRVDDSVLLMNMTDRMVADMISDLNDFDLD